MDTAAHPPTASTQPPSNLRAEDRAGNLPKRRSVWLRIGIYAILTYLISAPFEYLVIVNGRMGAGGGLYALGGMWSPAIAAFITAFLFKTRISSFGWKLGKARYIVWSFLIPLLYCLVGYGLVWSLDAGGLLTEKILPRLARVPLGLVVGSIFALGEEIGWSGFLVPQLAQEVGFATTALTRGVVWSVWHYPMIIAGIYANQTPTWFNLVCFTLLVTGISFVFTWLRLKSGSLWTGAFMHASHNFFVQSVFTPITAATVLTPYLIDEFGAALAILAVGLGILFWRIGKSLTVEETPVQATTAHAAAVTGH